MSPYESWSLILTAIYDLLTFGLLAFVAYEAVIKPRKENVSINFVSKPADTKSWGWSRAVIDFVIENRGPELKNVVIQSNPDFLGWNNLGVESPKPPRSTSEYFHNPIPILAKGERHQFFWCDAEQNQAVLRKPFTISVEYDNPIFPFPRRRTKTVTFDFGVFNGTIFGLNQHYDIHNVAQELTRIREYLEKQPEKNSRHETTL